MMMKILNLNHEKYPTKKVGIASGMKYRYDVDV